MPYNILPLDAAGASQPIMQFEEVLHVRNNLPLADSLAQNATLGSLYPSAIFMMASLFLSNKQVYCYFMILALTDQSSCVCSEEYKRFELAYFI